MHHRRPSQTAVPVSPAGGEDINRDLGFGAVVSRESRKRLLNRDGSFNVERQGLSLIQALSPYHFLLTTSWPKFLGVVVGFYFSLNVLFAFLYLASGPGSLAGFAQRDGMSAFQHAFFFSIQTFATIGYGVIHPVSQMANWLVTVEALAGMLLFTIATGLVWARFARPVATILWSERAIIAPYQRHAALMLRLANVRANQLIDLEAQVMLGRFREDLAGMGREFLPLRLERSRVAFFPLSWTIVHPIDERSPLWGWTFEELQATRSEFLVTLSAFDETFSQTVHARTSYTTDEMIWGARFVNVFNPPKPDGTLSIDVGKLHDVEPAELPAPAALGEGDPALEVAAVGSDR